MSCLNGDRIVSAAARAGAICRDFLDISPKKEMDHMLKKIGLVAGAMIGFSLVATPAFATPATPVTADSHNSAAATNGTLDGVGRGALDTGGLLGGLLGGGGHSGLVGGLLGGLL
jgi:hypothetical protein